MSGVTISAPKAQKMSGSGKLEKFPVAGNQALAWENDKDYTTMESNQTFSRLVNMPKEALLSKMKDSAVLAPGDPDTRAHELVAVGLIRKTSYKMIEVVTEVEWTPEMIRHKFRTVAVGGNGGFCPPGPSDCIVGYGGELTLTDAGDNKTQVEHTAYQEPALCHPCACFCCCQLCLWGAIGKMFLHADIDKFEKAYAKP